MDAAAPRQTELAAPALTDRGAAALPWYLRATLLGSTSILIGLLWDISWHSTIGRDTFWTPAHLAIYLGGLLAGASCGWRALRITFAGTPEEKAAAVRFWGFRAPLGAWVVIWGALAMLTSAPFDDWWHNAYGLDVMIISPPHALLAAGMFGIQIGTMLLALAAQNRAGESARRRAALAYLYAAAILLTMLFTLMLEYSFPNNQHGAFFYQISMLAYPVLLVGAARGARIPWPATTVAALYTAFKLAVIWILPLFPARPLLAPIHNPLDHMWPTPFPLLLVAPAFAVDLVLRRVAGKRWNNFLIAALLALAFLAVFLPVQWFFAEFMLSPYARNAFFAGDQWSYNYPPGDWQYKYWNIATDYLTALRLLVAAGIGVLSARVGLAWGSWMTRVQR